jgi:hypothetical protein
MTRSPRRYRAPACSVNARGSISLTVFPAVGLVGLSCRETISEGDGESIERRLPPYGPPGLSGAGGVEGPGDQVEARQRRQLGGEMASGLDRPPVAGVQRLDRVRAADDRPDLDVVVQERDELLPRVLLQPDDRPVTLPRFSARSSRAARAAAAFTAVQIGFTSRLRASQSRLDASRNVLRGSGG